MQEVKDTGNPAFDDLRDVYMKLGQVLGYFDKDGNIEKISIFNHGFLLAEGLLDEAGRRQGDWKEYYLSGKLWSARKNF